MKINELFQIIAESSKIASGHTIDRSYEATLESTLNSEKLIKVLCGVRRSDCQRARPFAS